MTGEAAIAVATELDGRKFAELEGALGPYAQTIPLSSQMDPAMPFRSLLSQVSAFTATARSWQEAFQWSVAESGAHNAGGSLVAYDFGELATGEYAGLQFSIERMEASGERFPLRLSARQRPDSFELALHFDASRLDRKRIGQWIEWFAILLGGAAQQPECPVERLPLISPSERARLLRFGNQTEAEYPRHQRWIERFVAQASRTPGRIALQCRAEQLSYRELNARANQVAHRLRRTGAGPGAFVGLCSNAVPRASPPCSVF